MVAQVLVPPIFLPLPGGLIIGGLVLVGVILFQLWGGRKVLGEGLATAVQWLVDRGTFIVKWVFEKVVEAWGLVAGPLRNLWDAIWDVTFELVSQVRDIVLERIPAALRWAADQVAALADRVTRVTNGLILWVQGLVDGLGAAIVASRDWLLEVPIAALATAVGALDGFVRGDAIPRLQDGIREAWDWARTAVKGVRLDLALLSALVAGGVMTAVRIVTRCSTFLRWLCGRPKDTLHAIMTGNWPILSLPIMLAAIRGLASGGDAVEDELSRYLEV